MLIPIEQVITRESVEHLRQLLGQGEWLDGRRTAGGIARSVKENLQLDETSELAQQLSRSVIDAVRQHPLFISAALPDEFFPPRFNCYQGGGTYGLHTDGSIMTLNNGRMIRTDVSATLFLSDADEYEGGELAIDTPFGAQEVKLNAGDLILYPSTSLHEVRPVTSGQRLASFFWVQSLVSDATRREILFDIDQSIQTLATDLGPDNDEVRRLSGVYHNLMRQWATP